MILSLVAVVAASAFGSVVIITKSALAFANVFDKREREDDSGVKLYPFEHVVNGKTRCVVCGYYASNATSGNPALGPGAPRACEDDTCSARWDDIAHLHMTCRSCRSAWLMRTAPADLT